MCVSEREMFCTRVRRERGGAGLLLVLSKKCPTANGLRR